MRILMLSDFYHPFAGGVEQHVRTLSTELVKRGHDVSVATLGSDELPDFETDNGVGVHRIRGSAQRIAPLFKNPGRPWAPPMPDPELMWSLRNITRRERPDVIHGHDWMARSFLPLKRWNRARCVVSLHYYTLSCAKKSLMYEGSPCSGPALTKCARCGVDHYGIAKGSLTLLGNSWAAKWERQAVDMFLPVSRATAEGNGLIDSGLPFEVIPNFVPTISTASSKDLEPFVAQLPRDGYLLYVGDLRRDKGLDVMLEAYSALENVPPLVLIGKIWPETPASYPRNVLVCENWPNYAVMEAWRRSTLALVPSVWAEPFGIVVIEAMVSGRPVIASRIGGIPDIVVDGETGVLVTPNDPDELGAAIKRLLADPALMAQMGSAGRRRAQMFEVGAVVPKIERVYERLVAGTLVTEQSIPTGAAGATRPSTDTVLSGMENDNR